MELSVFEEHRRGQEGSRYLIHQSSLKLMASSLIPAMITMVSIKGISTCLMLTTCCFENGPGMNPQDIFVCAQNPSYRHTFTVQKCEQLYLLVHQAVVIASTEKAESI